MESDKLWYSEEYIRGIADSVRRITESSSSYNLREIDAILKELEPMGSPLEFINKVFNAVAADKGWDGSNGIIFRLPNKKYSIAPYGRYPKVGLTFDVKRDDIKMTGMCTNFDASDSFKSFPTGSETKEVYTTGVDENSIITTSMLDYTGTTRDATHIFDDGPFDNSQCQIKNIIDESHPLAYHAFADGSFVDMNAFIHQDLSIADILKCPLGNNVNKLYLTYLDKEIDGNNGYFLNMFDTSQPEQGFVYNSSTNRLEFINNGGPAWDKTYYGYIYRNSNDKAYPVTNINMAMTDHTWDAGGWANKFQEITDLNKVIYNTHDIYDREGNLILPANITTEELINLLK